MLARARSLETWSASSRVGATMSACGLPWGMSVYAGSFGVTLRCSTGMPKASVLPVPVRAWPIRSVPSRATERVISWMAKGVVMPARSSASQMSGSTPSSRNVVRVLSLSCVVARPARAGEPNWKTVSSVRRTVTGTSAAHIPGRPIDGLYLHQWYR